MPPKPGPMPTVEDLLARTVPDGDCRLWTGATLKGYPVFYRVVDGRKRRYAGHRRVLELTLGRPIAPGLGALHDCDRPACLAPGHLHEGDQRANMQECSTRGRARNGTRRGEQHHKAKLTADDVRAIRASDDPQSVLALRYGVRQQTVSMIRAGRTWKAVV